jgi:uncharacterized protein YndB with AHSA1/START domain
VHGIRAIVESRPPTVGAELIQGASVSGTPAELDPSRGYTLTRTYDAPRALVWRAITESDLFARWFGAELTVDVHRWDLRVGGEWRATMHYEGNELPWAGRFMEIDEPARLVVAFIDQPAIEDVFELMIYTLIDHGGQTELVLRQSGGHLTDEQYEQASGGTASFLEEMAKVLVSLRG